jgi:HSP20 family molecular chaperone IbpA
MQVYREYHRSYMLPRELNPANLRTTLDQDGVLTLEAPLPALPPAAREETIPIEHVKK